MPVMMAFGMLPGGSQRSGNPRRGVRGHEPLLPLAVLLFIVVEILAGANGGDPGEVGLVPGDRVLEPVLEADLRLPAELLLGLGAVDGVAAVVAGAVLDVL